jgi:hypothetical protein
MFLFRRSLLALLLPWGLAAEESAPPTADAADDRPQGAFLGRLAESEVMATGVHELTPLQQANLENLIAYEVHSARAGGVNGFARTFSERRSEAEREATGIDHLSPAQRERLDQHIAGFIADQAVVPYVYRRSGRGEGPVTNHAEGDFSGQGPLLEVHGAVTVEAGTCSVGTYYGASATTVISDPKGRFQAVITYGTGRSDWKQPQPRAPVKDR